MEWLFEVCYRSRGIPFRVGYCLEFFADGKGILVRAAFEKAAVHTPYGTVFCRGPWTHPCRLNKRYSLSICLEESWMLIDFEDLILAVQACEECGVELPEGGFRRI